jgi:hypothetical protein
MREEIIPESRHQTLMHYLDKIEELISPETSNRDRDASSAEGEEGNKNTMVLKLST